MHISHEDYYSMAAWVTRTIGLPFRDRIKMIDTPLGATPPIEAWQDVERLADPDCPDIDAKSQIAVKMETWSTTYLTSLGQRRLSGVLRQRRHRRNTDAVNLTLPKTVYTALVEAAEAKGLTVIDYLRNLHQ